MEIRLNLAACSLKDAEHAAFIIGAYFGLTQASVDGVRVMVPVRDVQDGPAYDVSSIAPLLTAGAAGPFGDPDVQDPAQVFGGNAGNGQSAGIAPAPAGAPAFPTAAPSVPTVAAPAGTSPTPPTPPAPAASVSPGGVELDADGLPWDARINASGEGGGKPKNADGRWRKKRGLNDGAFVAHVQAELRSMMGVPFGGAAPQPMPIAAQVPPAPPVAVVPPAPVVVIPPPPPVAVPVANPDPTTFEQLMPRVTAAVQAGTIPMGALVEAVTAYQLPNIPALAQRPDIVPAVWAYLRSKYPAIA